MRIAYGITTFGHVDAVPGLFWIATRCFHVSYIPIVPLGSYVIVEENEEGIRGIRIPLSAKSYLVGIGRAALALATMILGFVGLWALAFSNGHDNPGLLFLGGAAGSFALLWLSRSVFNASRIRALQIAAQVGYPAEIVGLVFEARRLSKERRQEARAAAFAKRRAVAGSGGAPVADRPAPSPASTKPRPEPSRTPAYRAPEAPKGWRPPPPPSALAAAASTTTRPPSPIQEKANAGALDASREPEAASPSAAPRFLR